jgi:mRNA-degrading endonuclease RelE of RelBE toxin-antitoxin system
MSYNIILTSTFKKEAKKLLKQYSSLALELSQLATKLKENPFIGTPLGNDIYKIRLSIQSKNKGKSGGARVISCVKIKDENIYLLTIYNKGKVDNITKKEIDLLIKNI